VGTSSWRQLFTKTREMLNPLFSHCSVTYADEIAAASALASTQEAAASGDADVMAVMYGRDGRCGRFPE
jgi:hypothetical protein